jgi:hypothetical protein
LSRARALLVALALCALLPASAGAAVTSSMSAAFTPERLGAATTISLNFQIASGAPAPALLRGVDLLYPSNLGFATSGLGVAACDPSELEARGPTACPANSRMGSGSALVQIPIGPTVVQETATVALLAGPSQDGFLQILICATGETPVAARLVLSTQLLPGRLNIAVPPIPSLPEAPYVAVVRMHLKIGGHLTYYERVHGRTVAYHPPGVGLPRTCPRGGFPFAASFSFLGGGRAGARTVVSCPKRP